MNAGIRSRKYSKNGEKANKVVKNIENIVKKSKNV